MKTIFTSLFLLFFLTNNYSQNDGYVNTGAITNKNTNCGIGEIFVTKKTEKIKEKPKDEKEESVMINLVPNPTQNDLSIICEEKIIKLLIFDNLGTLKISIKEGELNIIDVTKLPLGIYNLHIYIENKVKPEIKTFIKL